MAARFEAWQRWWQTQAGPTAEQIEHAEAERRRRAGREFEERVLRACAHHRVFFPEDDQ